jgi:DNA gyrase subunit A
MEPAIFEPKGRAIQGVICHGITEKTGRLSGIAVTEETDDVMMITEGGTIVRTPVSGIPAYGRTASGVIVMRLAAGDRIKTFALAGAGADAPEAPEAEE